jgi:hypothetical protein
VKAFEIVINSERVSRQQFIDMFKLPLHAMIETSSYTSNVSQLDPESLELMEKLKKYLSLNDLKLSDFLKGRI